MEAAASKSNPPNSSPATLWALVFHKPLEANVQELQKCVKNALTNVKEKLEKNSPNLYFSNNQLTIKEKINFLLLSPYFFCKEEIEAS